MQNGEGGSRRAPRRKNPRFFRGFAEREARAAVHATDTGSAPSFERLTSLERFRRRWRVCAQDGTFGDSQRHRSRSSGAVRNEVRAKASDRHASGYSIAGCAMTTDEFETWFDKGVTDGLPVVPPTRERVERMLGGHRRAPATSCSARCRRTTAGSPSRRPPINAVLAGCRPEYLPVVIAAAECACDPAFNLHGVATSTHFSAPLIVVNGPIRAPHRPQ